MLFQVYGVSETTFLFILINQMDFIFQQWLHELSTEQVKVCFAFYLIIISCVLSYRLIEDRLV